MIGDTFRGFARRPGCEEQPGMAFMDREHGLAVSSEPHEVGFPVAGGGAQSKAAAICLTDNLASVVQ
jgi:hypothetical protein